jgi:hypothetical protein
MVMYAGIIGHAQGLETIIYAAEQLKDYTNIKFYIIGDRSVKAELIEISQQKQLTNIFLAKSISCRSGNLVAKVQ